MKYPSWLKKNVPKSRANENIRAIINNPAIHTVCESALCPNRGECFAQGTVTFMILGNNCSRSCTFCAVGKGSLSSPEPKEPQNVADAAAKLNLEHVVITSVTRDDLPDGGAIQFAETIHSVREKLPGATIEVLTPDFRGSTAALDIVLAAKPDVFNHNVETIERLYPVIRPQANYQQSLEVLRYAKNHSKAKIKSGCMVGLGETTEEIKTLLKDLQNIGVDLVTIGQYLAPSKKHFPVQAFIEPSVFEEYKKYGEGLGIPYVFAGPFVRSSYVAKDVLKKIKVSLTDLCG
jgi:lipoic acid synthetase